MTGAPKKCAACQCTQFAEVADGGWRCVNCKRVWTSGNYEMNEAILKALEQWNALPDDERNGERPYIMGFNSGWANAAVQAEAERDALIEALRAIEDGEGDAQEIARETLERLGIPTLEAGRS
jgi:hypothetical protein